MDTYILFADESGVSDLANLRQNPYVLCGCVVAESRCQEIKIRADQIKFKYWGRTDIVFHSVDIGRCEGDFSIFKEDSVLKKRFLKDLFTFLDWMPLTILASVSDKESLVKRSWTEKKMLTENARYLVRNFLTFLMTKRHPRGKVVIESASSQKNVYYLDAFAHYTSPSPKGIDVPLEERQKILTSISFVTKHNHDVEEQMADIFAYAAKTKYLLKNGLVDLEKGEYREKLLRTFEHKLFHAPPNVLAKKEAYYRGVESYIVFK